jgi:hypothetical protein
LLKDGLGDLGLAPHRIDGYQAAFDVEQRQQLGNSGNFIGLGVGFYLSEHQLIGGGIGTDHVNGRRSILTVIGTAQGFAIDSDQGAIGVLVNGLSPPHKGGLKRLWFDAGDDPGNGVMDRNAVFKQSLGLKPGKMNLAEILNIFPALSPADHGTDGEKQDIVEGIINLGMLARVVNIVEELSENGINRHESTPEKEHEITAGSPGQISG